MKLSFYNIDKNYSNEKTTIAYCKKKKAFVTKNQAKIHKCIQKNCPMLWSLEKYFNSVENDIITRVYIED